MRATPSLQHMKIDRRTAIKTSLLSGFGLMVSRQALADCVTTPDIEGPFYISGSKLTTELAPSNAPGTKMFITGTVYANDCKTPISNAMVDVWHANDGGEYEDVDYRGIIKTDASGKYAFTTILPGKYLNGATYRPRHFHYKVSAPDLDSNLILTTQIYFEGDTSIPGDPWASDEDAEERIITLNSDQNNAEHGVADITLDIDASLVSNNKSPIAGSNTIQSVYPNPITSEGHVLIELAKQSKVDLRVFDINGREVIQLLEPNKSLAAGEHVVSVTPLNTRGLRLQAGIYIVKLWVDQKPVDVKRFVLA